MQIFLYLIIMLIGAFIGSKNFIPEKFENKLSTLQNMCLLFLLGIMGYKIGINNDILTNFHRIGFKAFLIALLCIAFSILFVKLSYTMGGGSKNDN